MDRSSSIQSDVNLEVETVLEEEDVTLVSLFPARLTVQSVSGVEYVFNGAGSKVKVLKSDVEILLSKKRPKPCCGGQVVPYFELAS